jgi:hypothetical protein
MAVAITALVVALGGVAVASPIGGDGKVHLCYSQQAIDNPASTEGDLVVATNAGTACPDDFPDELVFSQAGPEGKVGPVGAPGAPGGAGPQGAPGGVKGLDKEKSKASIEDLKQADKLADKTKDKLKEIDAKLKKLDEKSQRRQLAGLVAQQIQAAEALAQINRAIEEMARAQRRIVNDLD